MEKIKYVHIVKNDSYRRIIVLYNDGTWEDLFQLHTNRELFNGQKIINKTRAEALDTIHDIILKD